MDIPKARLQGWLTAEECGELIGTSAATWRSYVSRIASCPKPKRRVGPAKLWSRAEVEAWIAARPGPGNWGKKSSRTS